MFAYEQNPGAFKDFYDARGHKGSNGIPDIVDEIKWGMDWLNKMNPEPGELYNQIADDRDHAGMRLPNECMVDYGYGPGKGRPVYFCSGEPQVRGKFMTTTTGVASTAGKFASCFAMGARILEPFFPEFAETIGKKADAAYQEGIKKPGYHQTASVLAPYIYEEENWVDDMELGAMELFIFTGNREYLEQAIEYGVKVFGITIHWVDDTLDGGKIIAQQAFNYDGNDAEEVHRIGQKIEHKMYVETIKKILTNL